MSLEFSKGDILFLQRILAVGGFYAGPLDGKWNKDIDAAEKAFDAKYLQIRNSDGEFDVRSEKNIMTMFPQTQTAARQLLAAAKNFKYAVKIISGTRTYAEQNALFAIGRTVQTSKPKVTNARGGQSNHNFCIAWDIGLFDKATGAYFTKTKPYQEFAAFVKPHLTGVEWGGDWTSFRDPPHYQMATGKTLKNVRSLFEAGKAFF